MAIRYQPTGTVRDTMQLAYRVGQKQASTRRKQEEARYARQKADQLRAIRREQMQAEMEDQLKQKAAERSMQLQLQKAEAVEMLRFQLDMEEMQAEEELRIKKNLEQKQKYQEALTFIHESDEIDEAAKPGLIAYTKMKYLGGGAPSSLVPRPNQNDQFSMLMQQLLPNAGGAPQAAASQPAAPVAQAGEIKVMKKSTGQIGFIPANELTDDYIRVP